MAESEYNDSGIGPIILGIVLGLGCRLLTPLIRLPFSVMVLFCGMLIAFIWSEGKSGSSALHDSLESWINIEPHDLAGALLPVLIFASAYSSSVHVLQREMGQFLWLAFPMVVVGAVLAACFLKYALPFNWGWNISMLLGSIVSATDPIAVVSLLEELGVSEDLGTIIEGESLFNDGSAFVMFEIFLQLVEGGDDSTREFVKLTFRLAGGGCILGISLGFLSCFALERVFNDSLTEIGITIVAVYSAWMCAESTSLKFSGILTMVFFGLVMNSYGKPRVSPSTQKSLSEFWAGADFIANILIFFATGLVIVGQIVIEDRDLKKSDWGYMISFWLVLYVIRIIIVAVSWPVLTFCGYGMTFQKACILVHSGLRGAVSLILALIVDGTEEIEKRDRDLIMLFVSGTACLTLIIQGSTTGWFVSLLGLDSTSKAEQRAFGEACAILELRAQADHDRFVKYDPFLVGANWFMVWRYIPALHPDAYWMRISCGKLHLSEEEKKDMQNLEQFDRTLKGLLTTLDATLMCWFKYTNLPLRIRKRWHHYHRRFRFIPNMKASFKAKTLQDVFDSIIEKSKHRIVLPDSADVSKHRRLNLVNDKKNAFMLHSDIYTSTFENEENEEDLEERRLRFLLALQAQYTKYMLHGRLPGRALRVLFESVAVAKDIVETGGQIDSWSYIFDRYCTTFGTKLAEKINEFSGTVPLAKDIWFGRISLLMEVAAVFVAAHQAVDRREKGGTSLLGDDSVTKLPSKIEFEVHNEISRAKETLEKMEQNYPYETEVVKTLMAVHRMLHCYEVHATELVIEGRLTEKEHDRISTALTHSQKALHKHHKQ